MELTGNIIIAPPAVKNDFWQKTVILITEHHTHGSVGLVLNKRSRMSLPEFGEQLNTQLDLPGFVYLGGPVNVKNLTFLHSPEWRCKNTLQINQHVSISSADDIIPRLSQGDTPERWRIFLGMAGWGPGQLEGELKGTPPWNQNTSWCTAHSTSDLIFGSDTKEQWATALDRSGLEFAQSVFE